MIQQKCSKITTLWFSHLYGLSARMSGRLTLLFPFLWVWTALAFPIRCPLMYRLESGRVSLSQYLSVVNLFLNLFVAASLIISAGLLDFDVAFCWLSCLHWNVGHKCCPESMDYSQKDLHQMLLVFHQLTHSLSLILSTWLHRMLGLDRNSQHQI